MNFKPIIRTSIAPYKAIGIPENSPRKSIREGASSLFRQGPESPKNLSCSRATPDLHRCKSGVAAPVQVWGCPRARDILGLSGPRLKRLLAPSLIDFRGGPIALYLAIGVLMIPIKKSHSQPQLPKSHQPGKDAWLVGDWAHTVLNWETDSLKRGCWGGGQQKSQPY